MSCYISTTQNRFYAGAETQFGQVPSISQDNRFSAIQLAIKNTIDTAVRRDKTGRTFQGSPGGLRTRSAFRLDAYLSAWNGVPASAPYAPLLESAMGARGVYFGGARAQVVGPTTLRFSSAHGLSVGQAVSCGGELRFVSTTRDAFTVDLNAPLAAESGTDIDCGATVTYMPGDERLSASLFDYWSPTSAIQRILAGAVVDELVVRVNGDYHEFRFSGPAAEVVDNVTFVPGQGGLQQFPNEPEVTDRDFSVIPGHLGQAWMGATAEQVLTLTEAEIRIKNNADLRSREFGQQTPRCFTQGVREVHVGFSLYTAAEGIGQTLYQAARQRNPMTAMFQLGEHPGQLLGVYMPSVVPEVPAFADDESRLALKFAGCRAQGTSNDEIVIALG